MIKHLRNISFALLLMVCQSVFAGSGLFFDISATGTSDNVNITLCLNGKGLLSCQNYDVSALTLSILSTIPNHTYPFVGIRINTPGFTPHDCTPISNGYCLFSVSNTTPASIFISKNSGYTIGGSIAGLTSSGLVLQNNEADNLTIPANATSFQFATTVDYSGSYNVTVLQQPTGLTCTLTNGSGSNVTSDVTNVQLTCAINILNYSNGPLVNGSGQGSGGNDASILQTNLGMNILGSTVNYNANFILADDFTIPNGETWSIDTLAFFPYQTGSSLTSTINRLRFVIYDDNPSSPSKNIVCGTLLSAATIVSNQWSQIYRVTSTTLTNTQRPIMQVTISSGSCVLPQGTYWLAWTMTGALGSGPFNPAITINGQTTTGNALQSPDLGSTWVAVVDSGTNTPQGFPFIAQGTIL